MFSWCANAALRKAKHNYASVTQKWGRALSSIATRSTQHAQQLYNSIHIPLICIVVSVSCRAEFGCRVTILLFIYPKQESRADWSGSIARVNNPTAKMEIDNPLPLKYMPFPSKRKQCGWLVLIMQLNQLKLLRKL